MTLTPLGGAAMLIGWGIAFLAAGTLVVDDTHERGGNVGATRRHRDEEGAPGIRRPRSWLIS